MFGTYGFNPVSSHCLPSLAGLCLQRGWTLVCVALLVALDLCNLATASMEREPYSRTPLSKLDAADVPVPMFCQTYEKTGAHVPFAFLFPSPSAACRASGQRCFPTGIPRPEGWSPNP